LGQWWLDVPALEVTAATPQHPDVARKISEVNSTTELSGDFRLV
jgi:hypothetical protein